MKQSHFAPGKLLLSGEYSILKGVRGICVPTHKGQHLHYSESEEDLVWQALDEQGKSWLDFKVQNATGDSEQLVKALLKDAFSGSIPKGRVETQLDFPRAWGLGSSSTLVSLIAKWANCDPWSLFFKYLKGSGYDLAVGMEGLPLSYRLRGPQSPEYDRVRIPDFFAKTKLIYLGQKQNSAVEVKRFEALNHEDQLLAQIDQLSEDLLLLSDVESLVDWMQYHEAISAQIIGLAKVKDRLFPDLPGAIKSLGAWGGDFAWYAGSADSDYFKAKGYTEVFDFDQLVKF